MSQIFVGDDVLVTMVFEDIRTKTLVDPSSVSLRITSPSGVVTTQIYPAGTITRDSLGTFSALIDITEDQKWRFKVTSTGPGKAGRPGSFIVTPDSDAS